MYTISYVDRTKRLAGRWKPKILDDDEGTLVMDDRMKGAGGWNILSWVRPCLQMVGGHLGRQVERQKNSSASA